MHQEISKNQLAGHWHCKAGRYNCDWLLQADGTFSATVVESGVTISHSIGSWLIQEGNLVSSYTSDEFGLIPSGLIEKDALLEVATDYFVLRTRQGVRRKYSRVKSRSPF